jgi:histone H3/H4
MKAPTREAVRREQQEEQEREAQANARKSSMSEDMEKRRRVVGSTSAEEVPQDVLVVVSKMKAYVKARSGMNTSDGVTDVLSDKIRKLCDAAIEVALADGRKTVMDRDFK